MEEFQQGFAKHCGIDEDLYGGGRAAPRHERVWLPSLCLSLYRGERGEGAPLGFPLGGGGQGRWGRPRGGWRRPGLRPGLGFPPPPGALPPKPRGCGCPRGAQPLRRRWRGLGGAHSPCVGCCVSPLMAHRARNIYRGPRNTFRFSDSFPMFPGTIPDSVHSHPIYQSSSPDHSGDPRHVRDLIRDSEQPSVTMHCSH